MLSHLVQVQRQRKEIVQGFSKESYPYYESIVLQSFQTFNALLHGNVFILRYQHLFFHCQHLVHQLFIIRPRLIIIVVPLDIHNTIAKYYLFSNVVHYSVSELTPIYYFIPLSSIHSILDIGMSFLLNCEATHFQKVLDLSSTRSLSHPELQIKDMRSYATKLNPEIWGMSWSFLSSKGLCLMKVVIL